MSGHRDGDAYRLDRTAVRRAFDAASGGYDAWAALQQEVGARLLDRLEFVSGNPQVMLDAGCGTGRNALALIRRYARCMVVGLDLSEGMLRQARRRRTWLRSPRPVCADAARLPLGDASVDLLFSNLMLQWCNDLDAVFAEFRRVLRPTGLLTFSTFGPDTLRELRQAWSETDGHVHVSRFLDMHDIGDALVRAGLAEPVMDVDYFRLTYDDVTDLMRDLKAIGASNATAGRIRGLTGRRRLDRVRAAYEQFRQEGRLPATWEVVYGHAWGPRAGNAPGRRLETGEQLVPVSSIGMRKR
jgi:malonyl-CoA O-methyltransferase